MTTNELKEYIKHYLEEDASHSAILLNAPWGTGKSYFIRNELAPYLSENGRERCVVVSLYGLKDLSEISKSIYFECRTDSMREKKDGAKPVGRTIVRGVASALSASLSLTDKDLQKLYDTLSLSDKLLVFEDVERSSIDVLEFMGYVNSLVELDNAKVLLVSNEREILRVAGYRTERGADGKDAVKPVYTESAEKYLRIKEKTVSDTLQYETDLIATLESILKLFPSKRLARFAEKSSLEEIAKILSETGEKNLRSFIFACQKTSDLFNLIDKNADEEFLRGLYFSNVIFSMNLKRGGNAEWQGDETVCYELGSRRYPLYRFAYDYIMEQKFPSKEFLQESYSAYKKVNLYNDYKSLCDEDLETLYDFINKKEIEVRVALKGVELKLMDESKISFIEYGKIASILVCLHETLGYDVEKCKQKLVENLAGKGKEVDGYHLFSSAFKPSTKEGKKEFNDLKKKMTAALDPESDRAISFDYRVESLPDLLTQVRQKRAGILASGKFLATLQAERLAKTVFLCSSYQIGLLRDIFREVYKEPEKLLEDKQAIETFLSVLQSSTGYAFDKIQILQLGYLIDEVSALKTKM